MEASPIEVSSSGRSCLFQTKSWSPVRCFQPHPTASRFAFPPLHINKLLFHLLVSMSQSQLGTAQLCQCPGCTRLVTIRDGLVDCLATLDYEQQDLDIAVRVFDELDTLHKSIGLRHEAAARKATQNDEGRGERLGGARDEVSAHCRYVSYKRG